MDNTEKKKQTTQKMGVPSRDGEVGIRATLNNMGFSNDSIGYNEERGMVTLGGKDLMKPTYLDDAAGVSYAPVQQIQKSLVDFYQGTSNPIVRVSDAYAAAAGKYGLGSDALSYGNGTVSIGGQPLNTLYIDDSGKSWAWQNDVERLAGAYAQKTGVQSPNQLSDRLNREYLSDIRAAIDSLRNREDFSYDPDSDPVYAAYKQKYLLEGNRASKNAMADYSALTGGYTNSAAVTAGALANQYYAQQLSNTIPQLAEQAYKRYYDNYQTDLAVLGKMLDTYNSAYDNAMDANRQTMENANASAMSTVQRDNAAYERQLSEEERYWNNILNAQNYDTQELENYWTDKLNNQNYATSELENYWTDTLNNMKLNENELKNIGYALDNEQQQIYLEYYRRLLDSELLGSRLDNQKTQADIYKIYAGIK